MDPRLLTHYERELDHLRETAVEFAKLFPKVADRLGMNGVEVTDPYVERLLEGFAFMAARVQLKIDAEFPRFTQRLLEIVYPNYLAPIPSMLVAQVEPMLDNANLARGYTLPRGSALINHVRGDATGCDFRTAHDVRLWPLQLTGAQYFSFAPDLPLANLRFGQRVRGGVRLKLRATAALKFEQLDLESLRFFLTGTGQTPYKLHELCLGACIGGLVRPIGGAGTWYEVLGPDCVSAVGFADDEALLPVTLRGFQGYRLLQEYFAFPERYLFIDIGKLRPAVQRHAGQELEIVLLFERGDPELESLVDASSFALYCTPAINLFAKRVDRVHVTDNTYNYHVVPDRARPMDYEVFEVRSVTGYGAGNEGEQPFFPLYAAFHEEGPEHRAYFTVQREPRLLSESQRRTGLRTAYVGSEVFISIVDPHEAPYRSDLRQLAITTLCTNRDLPLQMPVSTGKTDFALDSVAPVLAVRRVRGPSHPKSPLGEGARAWTFVSHLSLNYLSLLDTDERQGAEALRKMLELYALSADAGLKKQIEGVRSVRTRPSVHRLPLAGPLAYGRGVEIGLEVDELAFQGGSAFLFGAVMDRFFAKHVSINSFTETVLRSTARGEIMRWVPRCGARPIL